MLSYSEMMNTVRKIVTHFNWDTFGIMLYNFDDVTKGNSDCSLILTPFFKLDKNQSRAEAETFEEAKPEVLREKLSKLKEKSRSKFQVELGFKSFVQRIWVEVLKLFVDQKLFPLKAFSRQSFHFR